MNGAENTKTKLFKGKNLFLLPITLFFGLVSTPRCSLSLLNVFILLVQKGFRDNLLRIPQGFNPSYIKKKVIPSLATLKLKERPQTPIFKHISYIEGKASISYQFADFVLREVDSMKTKKKIKGKGYAIINVDTFFALGKHYYAKQLYLMLCAWQRGQTLDLYKKGEKSIFKLLDLPKSSKNRVISAIIGPALKKIHNKTLIDIIQIKDKEQKFSIAFKRCNSEKEKKILLGREKIRKITVKKVPYEKRPLQFGSEIVYNKAWEGQGTPKNEQNPPFDGKKFYNELLDLGMSAVQAKTITEKTQRNYEKKEKCLNQLQIKKYIHPAKGSSGMYITEK